MDANEKTIKEIILEKFEGRDIGGEDLESLVPILKDIFKAPKYKKPAM